MSERIKGPMPKSTVRQMSEKIRECAMDRMDMFPSRAEYNMFLDICTACGHTYSNALVPENGVRKTCGHCGSDAPQIHVTLSWTR